MPCPLFISGRFAMKRVRLGDAYLASAVFSLIH